MKPVSARKTTTRDRRLARVANRHGAQNATRIILECRARGVSISDGLALIEQESEFRNIFGGDHGPTPDNKAVPPYFHHNVTQARVAALLKSGMANGVGPAQLTSHGFVREADRDGGAHKPAVNIATGIALLGRLQKKHGRTVGFGAYNGGEGNPNLGYAREVEGKASRWHRRFESAGLA